MAVVGFATIGGVLIQILMQGVTFTSGKVGPVTIPRALKKIAIPPLVGMIIFGVWLETSCPKLQ
jgi:TRAP-type C4-dicarboxylate transport system permease large subunit